MTLFYKISIDRVNANYISGWCFHRFARSRPVVLECCCGPRVIGEYSASRNREDLRELGLHPTGDCGFEIIIDSGQIESADAVLRIRVKGSRTILAELSFQQGTVKAESGAFQRIKQFAYRLQSSTPTIIFMHIPKTAGTSFNTEVKLLLPRKKAISHIELSDKNIYSLLQNEYDYLSGHIRVGCIKQQFDLKRAKLYTIVREPLAQLHSHLKWLIQTSKNDQDQFFKYSNPIIYDLGKRLASNDLSDAQQLTDFVSGIGSLEAAFLDNMQTRYFLDNEPKKVTELDAQQAVANTAIFTLIGLTESYPAFVEQFSRLNGLPAPAVQKQLNISTQLPLFDFHDPEVQHILLPLVQFDNMLYQHVRRINVPA